MLRPKTTELLYVEDFVPLIALGREMAKEIAPDEPFDDEECMSNLFMVVNDIKRDNMNVWVSKDGDKIVGMGVGYIYKTLYSKVPIASLNLWYVKPEYRKSLAAFEILHNFELWARLHGAYRMEVGASRLDPRVHVEEADKINQIFKRRGFTRAGEVFYRIV